jgi:4'-phosphopantetheinyl transferase EntD
MRRQAPHGCCRYSRKPGTVLELLLPHYVAAAETRGLHHEPLYPEEEAAIARAVTKRREEFTAVRQCARKAMTQLGLPPGPIVPGPHGAPSWPLGVVGSMTHCDGYRGAAVGRAAQVLTIGIDAEPNKPLPPGVLGLVSLPSERAMLTKLSRASSAVCWDRLLFSVKESIYKAWFPLTGRWLGFEDAQVCIDSAAGAFGARLAVPGPAADCGRAISFCGRWHTDGRLLISAIAVIRRKPAPPPIWAEATTR